jgi:hypothetical protein
MAIIPLECVVSAEGEQTPAQKPVPMGIQEREARLKALLDKVKTREHRRQWQQ